MDGFSVAVSGPPFSPWLRLAHRWEVAPEQAHVSSRLRRLRDFEFFLQIEGRSWIAVGDAGHVPLPVGHLALIPPGLANAWGHLPGAHIAVHADLHANPRLASPDMITYGESIASPGPVLDGWRWRLRLGGEELLLPLVIPVDLPVWQARFGPLIAAYGARTHGQVAERLVAGGILAEAFAAFLAAAGATTGNPLMALLAEAAAGPPEAAAVPILARRLGMGETAFRTAVRRATGASPRVHIERLRLERAAFALTAHDTPIAQIASSCGYADPFHFSRAFTRVHGLSPSAWRERKRG